jgi:Membrane dipeptidase (Peptidase family M19)
VPVAKRNDFQAQAAVTVTAPSIVQSVLASGGPSWAQNPTQDVTPHGNVVPPVAPKKVVVGPALEPQQVSIKSVNPNPVNPGQTLTVTLSAVGSPTGCNLTLIPFGQGNTPSMISLPQLPPMEAEIPIPATLPLGYYAIEVNCNPQMQTVNYPSGGTTQIAAYVGTTETILVGGAPTVSNIEPMVTGVGPIPATMNVIVTGMNFGQTQGPAYVHLIGQGVPDVYIVEGISSWSNTAIIFTLPEYAAIGTYQVQVQTAHGVSAPMAFQVRPTIPGWVDLHAHPLSYLGFGGKLIYGAVDVGSPLPPVQVPPFGSCNTDPVAVDEVDALSQEYQVHGPGPPQVLDNACGDIIRYQVIQGLETTPTKPYMPANYTSDTYKTSGYQGKESQGIQDFQTWPAWNDLVDQRMWVNWIRRAYNGGLRVMVALAVNSQLLGDMTRGPGDLADDDKTTGDNQISQIKAFVGRHSDFMQIALSSSDVYNIVSQNKLAVVIGVELDNIGDLVGNQPASALVAEVDRLYGEGVRYIFPIHLVDNPIGGSAVYNALFDYANEYEEGSPYSITCSQPADNIGEAINTTIPTEVQIAEEVKLGEILPTPPSPPTCPSGSGDVNQKGLNGGVVTENSVRAENAEVPSIREILVRSR